MLVFIPVNLIILGIKKVTNSFMDQQKGSCKKMLDEGWRLHASCYLATGFVGVITCPSLPCKSYHKDLNTLFCFCINIFTKETIFKIIKILYIIWSYLYNVCKSTAII